MNDDKKVVKVLLATGLYPPEIGGPATYAQMLETELPNHGFELIVIPYGKVRHLNKFIRHMTYASHLFKASKKADLIYALDPVSVGFPAWFVSLVTRKPFMVRLGGDYAWEQGQQRFGVTLQLDAYTKDRKKVPLPVKVLASVQTFVIKRATKVVVPSEYLKGVVLTWGVNEEKIAVIYSALFPLLVEESKADLRGQLSFKEFTISSVGRLVPWKGFAALLEVVKQLNEEGNKVALVIAGDGPYEETLKEKVKDLGLQDKVRMVGRLSKDALGATIKASDCFVLNTGYEGLSHQILEVMDLGVPVVTTKIGGNPELITDGVSGLLVEFDSAEEIKSAIVRVMDNEALRNRLIQNARARTKDFAKEKVVAELAELLKTKVIER